jgi:hypothetical protein
VLSGEAASATATCVLLCSCAAARRWTTGPSAWFRLSAPARLRRDEQCIGTVAVRPPRRGGFTDRGYRAPSRRTGAGGRPPAACRLLASAAACCRPGRAGETLRPRGPRFPKPEQPSSSSFVIRWAIASDELQPGMLIQASRIFPSCCTKSSLLRR